MNFRSSKYGDAGDKYTGLDRFGRLVETLWQTSSDELVHTNYGRNRAGGVAWQRNVKAHTLSVATQDNYYWYDGLQQVTRHDQGNLVPSYGPPYTGIDPTTRQQQEIFNFDETGNWLGDYSQDPALSQSRTHNAANQIDSITGPSGVIQPAYDPAGNMTTMPKTGDWTIGNTLQWDAWNRLVKLTEGSSDITYAYDALTRRTTKTNASETRDYYYDAQWRALEERVSGEVKAEYVWSPLDRWTMIRRKRSVSGTLDETSYVLKDYLDPVAIIDTSATVIERFGYDAFGPVRFMDDSFAPLSASATGWNFLFHAEFLDTDSGLYNYGFRYYDPKLGRWLSRDPIGELGGLNLYGFVRNSVVNSIDNLGLQMSYPPSVAGAVAQGWTAAEIAEFFKISILAAAGAIDAYRVKLRCNELGLKKRQSINTAEALGACSGIMSCFELKHRKDVWEENARDRWNYDQECENGGDSGHIIAQQAAFKAMKNCEKLIKRACCS